jgi:hypothetical protein
MDRTPEGPQEKADERHRCRSDHVNLVLGDATPARSGRMRMPSFFNPRSQPLCELIGGLLWAPGGGENHSCETGSFHRDWSGPNTTAAATLCAVSALALGIPAV